MSNPPEPAAKPPAAHHPPHRRGPARGNRRPPRVLVAIASAAVLVWLAHIGYDAWIYEETDDAQIAGHIHQVSAEVGGPVQDVLVRENQTVPDGAVIARIDPLEYEIAVQKAEANDAQSRAEADRARAGIVEAEAAMREAQARIGQSEAQMAQTKAQASLAKLTLDRDERMLGGDGGGAVTQADVDAARSAYAVAQAAVMAAGTNRRAADAGLGSATAAVESARSQEAAAEAAVGAADAAVREARRELGYTTITAPAAGRIGNKNLEVGDRLQPGQVFLVLVEPKVWITANFKETQLARMRVGQPVEISVDALPGLALHGRVESLAPASGAEFALLPPDNATGNFTKVVQRVPVRIVFDPDSLAAAGERLRPGLSAVVQVRVR